MTPKQLPKGAIRQHNGSVAAEHGDRDRRSRDHFLIIAALGFYQSEKSRDFFALPLFKICTFHQRSSTKAWSSGSSVELGAVADKVPKVDSYQYRAWYQAEDQQFQGD